MTPAQQETWDRMVVLALRGHEGLSMSCKRMDALVAANMELERLRKER